MTDAPPFIIRRARSSDTAFIVDSWLKSYRAYTSALERHGGFFAAHKQVLACLLTTAQTYAAAVPDDLPEADPQHLHQVRGWVCAEPGNGVLLLHYCYVKKPFRSHGIARAMVQHVLSQCRQVNSRTAQVVLTHRTSASVHRYAREHRWGTSYGLPFYRTITAGMA